MGPVAGLKDFQSLYKWTIPCSAAFVLTL